MKLEAWIQAKYQISPYGLSDSEIYLAAKGSVIGEVNKSSCKSEAKLDWAVQLSGKVDIKLFDAKMVNEADSTEKTVEAALKFGGVIFRGQYPIFADTLAGIIVKTDSITEICGNTAKSGGFLKDSLLGKNLEKCKVIQRGVCWSKSKKPTVSNDLTNDGSGFGKFTSKLTGLTESVTYYVRAYAITESDTLYGNERSFIAGDEAKNVSKISIGDTLFGGIVFYIDGSGKHGLVMPMPELLPQFTAYWWPEIAPYVAPGKIDLPTDMSVGAGQGNTTKLLGTSSRPYIVGICNDLVVKECYDDWFLPSVGELLEMSKNIKMLPYVPPYAGVSSNLVDWDGKGIIIGLKTVRLSDGFVSEAYLTDPQLLRRIDLRSSFIPIRKF